MTGINQTLLLAISMLGIAAIMGAGGLGRLLYRAIANQDIALAGSGGLAFFIVAVVLDRLTQPDDGDRAGLLGRIGAAWKNTKTPELLLPDPESTSQIKPDEDEVAPNYQPLQPREQLGMGGALLGVIVTIGGLLLPWNEGAGFVSSYARKLDQDLLGSTFNGFSASGGSWFGFMILLCTAVVGAAVYATARTPGQRNRWLGPDGAVVFSFSALVVALSALLTAVPDGVTTFSRSYGVYVTRFGCLLSAVSALLWVWNAPMGARRDEDCRNITGRYSC